MPRVCTFVLLIIEVRITLPSVVGKAFCSKILIDCLVQHLDKSGKIHEGHAGFRAGRCCIDKNFTLN